MWGGQRDQLGLIGFCPAFPHLGHLDRIPSSPAVLFSKRLKTSSMYHPPHQSPASHALSASEGPWLPKFKEDTTPEGTICMQGMGAQKAATTASGVKDGTLAREVYIYMALFKCLGHC